MEGGSPGTGRKQVDSQWWAAGSSAHASTTREEQGEVPGGLLLFLPWDLKKGRDLLA